MIIYSYEVELILQATELLLLNGLVFSSALLLSFDLPSLALSCYYKMINGSSLTAISIAQSRPLNTNFTLLEYTIQYTVH